MVTIYTEFTLHSVTILSFSYKLLKETKSVSIFYTIVLIVVDEDKCNKTLAS